jgi:hypothetical protein
MAARAVKRGARLHMRTPECRRRSQVSVSHRQKSASFADGALASVAIVSTVVRAGLKADPSGPPDHTGGARLAAARGCRSIGEASRGKHSVARFGSYVSACINESVRRLGPRRRGARTGAMRRDTIT